MHKFGIFSLNCKKNRGGGGWAAMDNEKWKFEKIAVKVPVHLTLQFQSQSVTVQNYNLGYFLLNKFKKKLSKFSKLTKVWGIAPS